MTMIISSDVKIAVAQFGGADAAIVFENIVLKDVDWYLFDETADVDFELAQLENHYDKVFIGKFEEIK